MRTFPELKSGLTRLGIVVSACLLISLMVPLLKIYHFTLFNSGVSAVVAILVLIWIIYSVSFWIAEGFRKKIYKDYRMTEE